MGALPCTIRKQSEDKVLASGVRIPATPRKNSPQEWRETVANYQTDIVLGVKYRDRQTGLEGTAVVVSFHQHACERVVLEGVDAEGTDLKLWEFDAVRLVSLAPVTPPQPAPVSTGSTSLKGLSRSGRRP